MADREELIFKINTYTPETIPMARLAEYMADLARLLGEKDSVHFIRLDEGSTEIVHAIEFEAVPKVEARVYSLQSGNAPRDVMNAFDELNQKLANDNTSGVLLYARGAQIITFPGNVTEKEICFGPVREAGTIDGIVRRIGGKSTPVPVMLQTRDGFETHCYASREMSKELAKHYDLEPIRCNGTGTWRRNNAGNWELERFVISNFETLDNRSLPEILTEIHSISGADWKDNPNIWDELKSIRGDDESDQ